MKHFVVEGSFSTSKSSVRGMDQEEETNDTKTTKSPKANNKELKKGKSAVTAKGKRDTAIQGTNDSSIVSKRSVEKTGHAVKSARGEWLRYFVKKPTRRSPLINLGYFVRMKAIEKVVDEFLAEEPFTKRIIVNLGCGYDPLPFVFLSNSSDAIFVDVDFPDLIRHKAQIIRETPALAEVVDVNHAETGDELRSQNYYAVGCDLSDLSKFDAVLRGIAPDLDDIPILFISEVAITYMPTEAADALIAFTSKLPNAHFAILEQIAPAGLTHPFAMTMQNHFKKLNTPLLSLPQYPTLRCQARRFLEAGYVNIEISDLNTFFYGVMDENQRRDALSLELFDEFEELGAFLCHYFLLVARNQQTKKYFEPRGRNWQYLNWRKDTLINGNIMPSQESHESRPLGSEIVLEPLQGIRPVQRRFPAMASTEDGFLIHGGLSSTTRQDTSLKLLPPNSSDSISLSITPPPRMCHTMTPIGGNRILLVGGREAPGTALKDTWLFDESQWRKVQNFPEDGIYRHTAAQVNGNQVLVFGGRGTAGTPSSKWFLYSIDQGWRKLTCRGPCPALWGAALAWDGDRGVLVGGVDEDGNCAGDIYTCSLDGVTLTIALKKWSVSPNLLSLTQRYGAKIVPWGPHEYLVIGGAGNRRFLPWSEQFLLLSLREQGVHVVDVQRPADAEPWLIGHDVSVQERHRNVVVFGGGGVCFSFGSFWNNYIFQIHRNSTEISSGWNLLEIPLTAPSNKPSTFVGSFASRSIRHVKLENQEQWKEILQLSEVCILEGLNFGSCINKWTPEYLKSRVGYDKEVVIHSTDANAMNFLAKNFKYTQCMFGQFIDTVFHDTEAKVYLRALSDDAKNKPARLEEDFPGLASDFEIPGLLVGPEGIPTDRVFSSILRIGSVGTSMWLHYDVMANILTQVVGEKEILVFHPSTVNELDIPPGASSSRIQDPFSKELQHLGFHGILRPGDAVYIPPLWPHATRPSTPNVGVNVFWKSFKDNLYDRGKDVYGNKDILNYTEGRKLLERIAKSFKNVDGDTKEFYMKRLASELESMAR